MKRPQITSSHALKKFLAEIAGTPLMCEYVRELMAQHGIEHWETDADVFAAITSTLTQKTRAAQAVVTKNADNLDHLMRGSLSVVPQGCANNSSVSVYRAILDLRAGRNSAIFIHLHNESHGETVRTMVENEFIGTQYQWDSHWRLTARSSTKEIQIVTPDGSDSLIESGESTIHYSFVMREGRGYLAKRPRL